MSVHPGFLKGMTIALVAAWLAACGPGVTTVGHGLEKLLEKGTVSKRVTEGLLEIAARGLLDFRNGVSDVTGSLAACAVTSATAITTSVDVSGCADRQGQLTVTRRITPTGYDIAATHYGRPGDWLDGTVVVQFEAPITGSRVTITHDVDYKLDVFDAPFRMQGAWAVTSLGPERAGVTATLDFLVGAQTYQLVLTDLVYQEADDRCRTAIQSGSLALAGPEGETGITVADCMLVEESGLGIDNDLPVGRLFLDFSRQLRDAMEDLEGVLESVLEAIP